MDQITFFDQVIESEIKRNNLAGANLLLIKDGTELVYRSYGMADIEKQIPMKRDTIFRLFSMSKPVTAVAAMILMERGVLDMYDPVSKYLPSYRSQSYFDAEGKKHKASREVLVRDLLNMTSGLAYPDDCTPSGKAVAALFDEMGKAQDEGLPFSTVTLAERLGQIPLSFDPGAHWQYGTSADVLGAVVEIASGKRLGQFLEDEIFTPLDMPDTGFFVPEHKRARFAQLYRCFGDNTIAPEPSKNLGIEPLYDHSPSFESGGAGLVSTIDDYSHFAQMLLGEGMYNGNRILSPATVRFLCSVQLDDSYKKDLNWDSLRGYGYGNLMRHLISPAEGGTNASVGEYGWDGWVGTYFTVAPADQTVLIYFVQRCDTGTNEVTRKIRSIAFSLV